MKCWQALTGLYGVNMKKILAIVICSAILGCGGKVTTPPRLDMPKPGVILFCVPKHMDVFKVEDEWYTEDGQLITPFDRTEIDGFSKVKVFPKFVTRGLLGPPFWTQEELERTWEVGHIFENIDGTKRGHIYKLIYWQ